MKTLKLMDKVGQVVYMWDTTCQKGTVKYVYSTIHGMTGRFNNKKVVNISGSVWKVVK